jgi:glycosyltransferase involved in cell wall biosynthesis
MKVLVLGSLAESLVRFRGHLLSSLLRSGVAVHAAAPGISGDVRTRSALVEMRCKYHDVPIARTGLNPFKDISSLVALMRLMYRERPSHFLGYTIKPVIYGLIAARIAGVEHRTALVTGLGYAFSTDARGARGALQRMIRLLYKLALGCSTRVVFQNPDDRELFIKLGLTDRNRTALINGSGVPLDEFQQRPLPADGQCHFLLIARLLRDKGIYEYIDAARRVKALYPHAVFNLVGWIDSNPSAIEESDLKTWIDEGVIRFHGRLSNVQEMLAESHVYVLPSYREGTPRTVLEAMATGRAVITTDAPGCRETVIDGDNGFLVPVKDPEALVLAMKRFVENPKLIAEMGQRSREIAEEKYDVNRVNEQMLKHMGITE